MSSEFRWSASVADGEVNNHPCRLYQARPSSILAAVQESRRWGERPFIRHGNRTVTFNQHQQMVGQFAEFLRDNGVRQGDRVGIFAANSPEWVAMFFASMAVGAIAVPLNGWWSREEVANACALTTPALVVVDQAREARLPEGVRSVRPPPVDLNRGVGCASFSDVATQDDSAPAVILFTAGTTSFPKGAVLSHRALVANLQTLLVVANKLPHQVSEDATPSVALVGLPLFHIGAIQLILVPLMTGSQIVFLEGRFDPEDVLSIIEKQSVTMFSGVPTMMERLLTHDSIALRDVRSLRTIVLGGAPVDDALLIRTKAAFPSSTRGVGQTYGLTEAGGVVATGVGADIASHPGSSGRLAPVVEVRVENPDSNGNGELWFRSPAAMDGYWGIDDDTSIDTEGWINTGDLGHVDNDGYLYVTGRAKDVIIRGGENISAARVEAVLRAHPHVQEAAVLGLPDSDLGEVVAAVVQRRPDSGLNVAELEDFTTERLARFAVPARWWIRDEPLPLNDAGKILKRVLLQDWLFEQAVGAEDDLATNGSGGTDRG